MNPIYLENSRPKHQDCTQSPAILNRRICLYIKNIFILLQPPLVELNCWAISKEKHTKNLQLRFIFFVSSFLAFSSGLLISDPATVICAALSGLLLSLLKWNTVFLVKNVCHASRSVPELATPIGAFVPLHQFTFYFEKKLNYFMSQNVRIKNPVKVLHILTWQLKIQQ